MFSRVLAFYGLASVEVLRKTPLKTFWMLHKNVDRISAERDQRSALIAIKSQSSEGMTEMMKDLRDQMGTTIVTVEHTGNTKLDVDALHGLSAIGDLNNHVYPG